MWHTSLTGAPGQLLPLHASRKLTLDRPFHIGNPPPALRIVGMSLSYL